MFDQVVGFTPQMIEKVGGTSKNLLAVTDVQFLGGEKSTRATLIKVSYDKARPLARISQREHC